MLNKKIFYIVFISLLVKLVVALTLPVVGDEAYYWFWGQNLQLSYFDHPGMVAWLTTLANYFPIAPHWVVTRIIFVLLSSITFLVWIKTFLLRHEYAKSQPTSRELYIFSAFFFLNPFLGLGNILITPDAPLLLFWGLSSYFVTRIISHSKTIDYIGLGISLGLGFCSKYHIVLFPIVAFVALALEKNLRAIFNKKTILTIVFGLLFSLPVLIWNYNNDFISFKFQLNHGFKGNSSYQLWWTSSYLLGQILVFNPVLLFALLFKSKKSFFNVSALGQWCFFLYSSFKAKVEANWPLTSHAAGLIDLDLNNKKIVRYSLIYYAALWLAFIVLLFSPLGEKKLSQLPTSLTVHAIASDLQKYTPLYGPTYQMSSLLSLLTDSRVYKLRGLSRYDFFDSLPQSQPFQKNYYVLKYSDTSWPKTYDTCKKTQLTEYPKFKLELYEFVCE